LSKMWKGIGETRQKIREHCFFLLHVLHVIAVAQP